MAFYLDGIRLIPDVPFKDGRGFQYPANWLRLSSEEERIEIGIEEKEEEIKLKPQNKKKNIKNVMPLDDKPVKNGTKIVRDQNGKPVVKRGYRTIILTQEKQKVKDLLESTDCYIIRKLETGLDVPESISNYRKLVREIAQKREDLINNAKSCDELQKIVTDRETFPQFPEKVNILDKLF